MRPLRVFLFFAVLLGFCTTSAMALPITWLLEGRVNASTLAGIAVGDPASMLMTFESSAADFEPNPNCGLYLSALLSESATFGSQTYTWTGGISGVEISTGVGLGGGGVVACGIMPGNVSGLTYRTFGGGGPFGRLVAFFEDGPVFSDVLPLQPPSLPFFDAGFFVDLGQGRAVATMTSARVVPVSVPEPATLLLLGTGVTGALVARRRRRRDT